MNKLEKIISFFYHLPRQAAVRTIELYQIFLSPDHSWLKARFPHGYCRFYPTCSQYGKEAITKFGLVKGTWLAAKRVSRCHPWAEPKVDLVPERN